MDNSKSDENGIPLARDISKTCVEISDIDYKKLAEKLAKAQRDLIFFGKNIPDISELTDD